MIGKTISQYEIVSKIGEGGMGVVYKARDTKLDRFVALKFLPGYLISDEEQRERFRREAQSVSSLDHPNICTVYEIGKTNQEQMFISMAFYDGATLKAALAEQPLPLEKMLRYSVQIARGLSRAHEADVVHRDIKPANIVITTRDEVKLLDFGLAKLARSTGLTRTGTTMGTVAYMSPEQAKGTDVDQRTDLWSLGVIMYEMLAGRQPYQADFEHAVIYSILNEDPPRLSEIAPDAPEPVIAIVEKAMTKDAKKRYASADELLADLEPLKNSLVGESPVSGTRTRPVAQVRQKRVWGAGLVSVIVIAALAVFFLLPREPSRESETLASAAVEAASPAKTAGEPEASPVTVAEPESLRSAVPEIPTPPPTVAERQPAAEPEPKPAAPKIVAAPDRSAEIRRERDAALEAKTDAEALSAATLAPETFASAARAASEAEQLAADGDIDGADGAIERFGEARALYTSAADEARRLTAQLREQAEALRNRAREASSSMPADFEFLAEYRQAAGLSATADTRMGEENYPAAIEAYELAIAQYGAAVSTREQQVADINDTVDQYARALEAEDLDALSKLHINFTKQARDGWSDFFRSVKDLRARVTVNQIKFHDRGATAMLSVQFLYSGARGQDNVNSWEMETRQQEGRWLISEVRRES